MSATALCIPVREKFVGEVSVILECDALFVTSGTLT